MNKLTYFSLNVLIISLTLNIAAMEREKPVAELEQQMQAFQLHNDQFLRTFAQIDDAFKQSIAIAAAHEKDCSIQSQLINAILDADHEILPALVDAGADVNGFDEFGTTPLIRAIKAACVNRLKPVNYDSTINYLIALGASPNLADCDDATPVRHAARAGKQALINLLKQNGAEVDQVSADLCARNRR